MTRWYELAACALRCSLAVEEADGTLVSDTPYTDGDSPSAGAGQPASLTLDVTFELPHASLPATTALTSRPALACRTVGRSAARRVGKPVLARSPVQ